MRCTVTMTPNENVVSGEPKPEQKTSRVPPKRSHDRRMFLVWMRGVWNEAYVYGRDPYKYLVELLDTYDVDTYNEEDAV